MNLSNPITFAKSHLILLALVLAVAGFATYLFIDRAAQKSHDEVVLAQQELKLTQQKHDALFAMEQQQIAAILQQEALLEKAIATRTTVLVQQQKTDKQLKPTELGNRLASLVGELPSEITADNAGNFQASQAIILASVLQLEKVPVLEATVQDLRTEVKDRDITIGLKDQEIISDHELLAETQKADAAKLNEVVKKSRRSKFKIAIVSYVAGFLTRKLVGF